MYNKSSEILFASTRDKIRTVIISTKLKSTNLYALTYGKQAKWCPELPSLSQQAGKGEGVAAHVHFSAWQQKWWPPACGHWRCCWEAWVSSIGDYSLLYLTI